MAQQDSAAAHRALKLLAEREQQQRDFQNIRSEIESEAKRKHVVPVADKFQTSKQTPTDNTSAMYPTLASKSCH